MKSNSKNCLAIFYLSYIPYGINHLKDFLESYIKYKPYIEHELIILFNGYSNHLELEVFKNSLKESSIEYNILLSPEKFDIGSYFFAASQNKTKYQVFLNTYSRFLHSNWLSAFYTNIQKDDVGVIGCTGAWGDFGESRIYGTNVYKRLKSWIVYTYNFPKPIGPHLRTNAFCINREIFLSLEYRYPKPFWLLSLKWGFKETKFKTLCFEHGNFNMTKQIIKKGLKVLIIDKSGNPYNVENWRDSNIYWNGDQENLLIRDNHTAFYTNASNEEKEGFKYRAWGIKKHYE